VAPSAVTSSARPAATGLQACHLLLATDVQGLSPGAAVLPDAAPDPTVCNYRNDALVQLILVPKFPAGRTVLDEFASAQRQQRAAVATSPGTTVFRTLAGLGDAAFVDYGSTGQGRSGANVVWVQDGVLLSLTVADYAGQAGEGLAKLEALGHVVAGRLP